MQVEKSGVQRGSCVSTWQEARSKKRSRSRSGNVALPKSEKLLSHLISFSDACQTSDTSIDIGAYLPLRPNYHHAGMK